ncbi:hypothetical protein LCGC14_1572830 [marine sediment metagenome]|uniref:Scaffolding protein n=1 Tax=marine sediment metagenome TaxID=412755 RepID=A0A0F9IJD3_9ZZZZ
MADGTVKPEGEVSTPTEKQETPTEKTYSQTDIEKIRSDAAAEVGRATKAAETAAAQAKKASERTNKYIEQSRVAELEAKRDEPDALSVIRTRHAREELEDELATKNTELETVNQTMETMKAETQQNTKELYAREIATRLQVDVEDLLLTDGSKEAMEKLALKLTKTEEAKLVLRVDQGGGVGSASGRKPTVEELKASDPLETQKKVDAGEWKL